MTVTSEARSVSYTDVGQTIFPITFRFLENAHLVVTITLAGASRTLALGVGYTATGAGGASGTLTLTAALVAGEVLTIERVVPLTQPVSLRTVGKFSAGTHENALDRLTMAAQQIKDGAVGDMRDLAAQAASSAAAAAAAVAAAAVPGSATLVTATGGPTQTLAQWQATGPVAADAALVTAGDGSPTSKALRAWASDINTFLTDAPAAEAARIAAEAARDAAATAGATYVDTATGIAAVTDGAYFYVPAGDTLIRYRRSGAAAVEVGRLPSGAAVSAIQASLTPAALDASAGLFYVTDAAGRVIAWLDSAAGLRLVGLDGTAQARLAAIQQASDTESAIYYILDAYNRVVAHFDAAAGLNLAGLTGTVQALLTAAGLNADLAIREQGSIGGTISLPAAFTPMGQPLRGQERFIWSGSPPTLRLNSTRFTAYPFDWTTDPVATSAVRRVRATLAAPTTWIYDALTVNAPGGFFTNRQFRDISWLYDRKHGKYWYAVNAISSQATGFLASDFPIFSSTDGTTLDYVGLVSVIPGPPTKIWSPEFFIDDDGTVYVIVCADTGAGGAWAYHLVRCTDTDTFTAWAYVGVLTGSAFPTNGSGVINMIDPWMFKRDGVYYVYWKQETIAGGSSLLGQLGVACSPTLLGPYNTGHAFVAPGPVNVRGEGGNAVELPAGSAYRFRYLFDDYLGLYAPYSGGQYSMDTSDFATFTSPAPVGLVTYKRHTTFVIGD